MASSPRARNLLLLLAFALPLLAGCWDRKELESQAYIIVIGVDRGADGRLIVTARVPLVGGLAPGIRAAGHGRSEGLSAELITAQADTLIHAIYILNGSMARTLNLYHLRSVLVGEELAREGLGPLIEELGRIPSIRNTAALIVTRGKAGDVLQVEQPIAEINPAKLEEDLMLQAKRMHMTPPSRLHHFMIRRAVVGTDPFTMLAGINENVLEGRLIPPPPDSALPGMLPRMGGNPVENVGTAIFRDDRLAGFITVDETQMLLALRGEMGKAHITVNDPLDPAWKLSLRLHQENLPKFEASFAGSALRVRERLLFEAELLSIPSGVHYADLPNRKRLEEALASYCEKRMGQLLRRLKEWEADPVGYGLLFRPRFPSYKKWVAYGWHSRLDRLDVNVDVKVRVRRYGLVPGAPHTTEVR